MLISRSKMRRTDVIASSNFSLRAALFLANLVIVASCAGSEAQPGARDWDAERARMVDEQLRARDIRNARVLDAMLRCRAICSFPKPCAPRPTAILRCQSATSRPSPSPTSSRS